MYLPGANSLWFGQGTGFDGVTLYGCVRLIPMHIFLVSPSLPLSTAHNGRHAGHLTSPATRATAKAGDVKLDPIKLSRYPGI